MANAAVKRLLVDFEDLYNKASVEDGLEPGEKSTTSVSKAKSG